MANATQTPKLQLGKLSPEDAERLASTFRPIWDLDDAPFAQGSALSAADVDALAGGAGVTPSIRGTLQQQDETEITKTEVTTSIPRPSMPGHVPAPDAPKVEIAIELDTAELVSATPAPVQAVAQPRSQPPAAAATVRKPYTPPRAPPPSVNMREADASADFRPVKKSNTPIIIGAAAVVAIIAGIFVVKSMSGDKTQSTDKTSASQTNHEEGTHIPPPPPEIAATQETAAPTQTQAPPVVTAKATNDSPIVKEFPGGGTSAPPPTTTHTATIHNAPHGGTTHPSGGGTTRPAGKPAIVRDNPF